MSWWGVGAAVVSTGAKMWNDNKEGKKNRAALDGGSSQLLDMPTPAPRNLNQELVGNYDAAADVGQRWIDKSTELAHSLGNEMRSTQHEANPEMYGIMRRQDAGVSYDRIDPNWFMGGGQFAQDGGGGAGMNPNAANASINPMMIAGAARYSPQQVQAMQLGQVDQSALLGQMNTQAQGQEYNPLTEALSSRALSEVQLGGQLSEQEQRSGRENMRTAYEGRGMYQGNAAMADEVLNLDAVSRQRMMERMNMGLAVDQNREGALQNMRGYELSVEGMNQSHNQLNTSREMANQSSQLQGDISNQGAGLTANAQHLQALMADQSTRFGADQFNVNMAQRQAEQSAAAAQAGASAGNAANNANMARYLEAMKYNNSLTSQEFDSRQMALDNRMRDKNDPLGVTLEMMNPYNQYAQQLNAGNYDGAWSGYNAEANVRAAQYAGQAQLSAAKSAGNADMFGGLIGGLSTVGAAYFSNRK